MPNARSVVKQAHERYQVKILLDELNVRHGASYSVISEPEPPEAIIRSNQTTRWVEVVTVYLNTYFAKDLNSFATEGEDHKSISGKLIVGPEKQFCQNFISVVRQKLEKKTYEKFRDQYGPGYLLISIQNPFFGDDTLITLRESWREAKIRDLRCFRSMYLTYRVGCGYRIQRWVPPP